MRPFVSVATELTCCTNTVGEKMPERTATMNLIFVVFMPMAAARTMGSGRWKPKAVSTESMPHSSACRQKLTSVSSSWMPTAERACAPRYFSPAEDMLQRRRGLWARPLERPRSRTSCQGLAGDRGQHLVVVVVADVDREVAD